MTAADTVAAITEAVARSRFSHVAERGLHEQVGQVLAGAGLDVESEVRLAAGDRVDLLVGGDVGVEVKVKGTPDAVGRQLARYAASDRVAALVLVTTKAAHRRVPRVVDGKPVTVLFVASPM